MAGTGVERNERLTASTAVILFVLLAVEGVTVLSVRSLLRPHVFVGMLLIPPVVVKIGSTVYRFARYYTGAPAYRRKGPPAWFLRVLGPGVVVLTVVMFGSGVALLVAPAGWHDRLFTVHKVSFILWFVATAVHVLAHLGETVRLGLPDWIGTRWSRAVSVRAGGGAGLRRGLLVASLVVGVGLGALLLGRVGPYLTSVPTRFRG